jgi:hypothetical protein
MASVQQVVEAGGRLRDALYDQLITPNLPDPAFDAIDEGHLHVIRVLGGFTASPKSGDRSSTYDPIVRVLNSAADEAGAVNPFNAPALATVLAQSDAAARAVKGVTSGGVNG